MFCLHACAACQLQCSPSVSRILRKQFAKPLEQVAVTDCMLTKKEISINGFKALYKKDYHINFLALYSHITGPHPTSDSVMGRSHSSLVNPLASYIHTSTTSASLGSIHGSESVDCATMDTKIGRRFPSSSVLWNLFAPFSGDH